MGLTKQYLRYQPGGYFGLIASSRANLVFVAINDVDGRFVAVGSAENVLVWDLRTGEKLFEIKSSTDNQVEVACLAFSPDRIHLAIGRVDGTVEIYNIRTREVVCKLSLHRTAVNCLRFDELGLKLVSGGLDTDMVVSDMVAQTGEFRLSGHSAPVTDAHFMQRFSNVIVSCSKDTQIKFWDIATQFCFKTIVDHRTDVWALALMRNNEFLVAGAADNTLRVYAIGENTNQTITAAQVSPANYESIETLDDSASPLSCNFVGTIQRTGKGRTMTLVNDSSGTILGCHGTDTKIELFYFCDLSESINRLTKRLKKLSTTATDVNSREISLSDRIKRLPIIKTEGKIKSFDLVLGNSRDVRVAGNFANNTLRLFALNYAEKKSEAQLVRAVTQHGHQGEMRSVCFSSDSLAIATGSGESVKLWSRGTQSCLRTVALDHALCTCFVPGDRHLLVGLKSGSIKIVDIVIGEIIQAIQAHEKECFSLCLMPDLRGFASGGGDKKVKLWTFELVTDREDPNKKVKKSQTWCLCF